MFQNKQQQYFFYDHDLHSHILPGLDDGVRRLEDAVLIVTRMLALGVKRFTFTPHVMFPALLNTRDSIRQKFDLLLSTLQKEGIELDADYGAEYQASEHVLQLIRQGEIIASREGNVLVEHSFYAASPFFNDIVFSLTEKGFTPILAHPERYPFYEQDIVELCGDLKQKGCRLQVNLLSFTGFYGKDAKRKARLLASAGIIDHVSGDIHSLRQVELLERFLRSKESGRLGL